MKTEQRRKEFEKWYSSDLTPDEYASLEESRRLGWPDGKINTYLSWCHASDKIDAANKRIAELEACLNNIGTDLEQLGLDTSDTQEALGGSYPATGRVNGFVINVGEDSVLCGVKSLQGPMSLFFPRDYFPDGISYGTPFDISIEERNGFPTPVIRIR